MPGRTGKIISAFLLLPILITLTGGILAQSVSVQSAGGYLGVYLGNVNEERARGLNLPETGGAVVGKVEEDSPAARAGIRENDVILAFNDRPVRNRVEFFGLLIDSAPGSKVTLSISRGGERQKISVELGRRSLPPLDVLRHMFRGYDPTPASQDDRSRAIAFPNNPAATRYYLGLAVGPLTEQLAKFFNLPGEGVLICEVRTGGAAERAGMKAGDCITALNDLPVTSPSEFTQLISLIGKDRDKSEQPVDEVVFTIISDRREKKVKVKIDQR
ncbi:MAG: PDZ domain-containing protein [Acidobacteria bacterium]|nr:PDZ domain-containing protein [Acidobacteriota bacterium]